MKSRFGTFHNIALINILYVAPEEPIRFVSDLLYLVSPIAKKMMIMHVNVYSIQEVLWHVTQLPTYVHAYVRTVASGSGMKYVLHAVYWCGGESNALEKLLWLI